MNTFCNNAIFAYCFKCSLTNNGKQCIPFYAFQRMWNWTTPASKMIILSVYQIQAFFSVDFLSFILIWQILLRYCLNCTIIDDVISIVIYRIIHKTYIKYTNTNPKRCTRNKDTKQWNNVRHIYIIHCMCNILWYIITEQWMVLLHLFQ